MGIDVFIIENTKRSDPVKPLIHPMEPIIPTNDKTITKRTIITPENVLRLAKRIITIISKPIRIKNSASSRTKSPTTPIKYEGPPK